MGDEAGKLFDDSPVSPGSYIRDLLVQRRWTQDVLAAVTGRSRQQIIDLVADRRGITAEMAVALGAAFGNSPSIWLKLDSAYRLSKVEEDGTPIQRRAHLLQIAPIKDMQKRGWIKLTMSDEEIEGELRKFFGAESLNSPPEFPVSFRKFDPLSDLTPSQRVWLFRARQLATAMQVEHLMKDRLGEAKAELRRLAAYPGQARNIPDVMTKYGIRFVVIEPLPGKKIDGAAFWLDDHSPVIAISAQVDRIVWW